VIQATVGWAVAPFDPQPYRDLAVPTLVLVGELSNPGSAASAPR
jgi:hypothetical protein